MAGDLALLMQPEVGEVSETFDPDRGGSSAMPHKRNPVGCLIALTASKRVPHLVAILYTALQQEHERALGGWQAEWTTIPSIIETAAGSLASMADLAEKVTANPDVMRQNLDSLNGLTMSERVTSELAKKIGREEAVGIVTEACRAAIAEGANLSDILRADDRVMKHLTTKDIKELMTPEGYVGTSLNIRSEKR